MAAITICSDFGAQKDKVWHCFHCFPIYLPWSDGTRCHDLRFLNTESFKPTFSLSSFTCIKRLFSSSLLSAIRVVSSAYLRLLIFFLVILIQLVFLPVQLWDIHTMEYYSAIKKNTSESVLMRWMKLEPIIQHEVSQREAMPKNAQTTAQLHSSHMLIK